MKTFLVMLAVGSSLVACKKNQGEPVPSQTFELPYQQATTVLVRASDKPVQATLTQVYDSRCPANAYCIWAGYAAVVVQLTDEAGTAQTARLSLHFKDPSYATDSATVVLKGQAYWLRLLAVNPYPGTSSTSQLPTATLRLRPQ